MPSAATPAPMPSAALPAPSAASRDVPPAPVVDPASLPDIVADAAKGWPPGYAPPLERERARVVVVGVAETWILRWKSPPESACFTRDGRASARCQGFPAGAEIGPLELVRTRDGVEVATFDLADVLGEKGRVVMPRYATDVRHSARALAAARPIALMSPADVNQDGNAAEIVLRGQYRPWGERAAYLIGFGPSDGKPFAFHSSKASTWEGVRTMSDSLEIITLPCLDHASPEEQIELFVKTPGGVTRERKTFPCSVSGSKVIRGKPTASEPPIKLGW